MTRPLTQSDLIFPTQSLNFSTTLHSLKRSALSITNRLSSISADSAFVSIVAQAYGVPLVANERCGSWYISPENKVESVYFKSTDGHMNEWSFNLRRLNYQVLNVVNTYGGCVIVDSTRRGKSMPDALSKTIPIWCCVMNRVMFPKSTHHKLYTPPQAISASEHAQIEKRIDRFVRDFVDICKPNVHELRTKLQKPLRPLWVTQESTLPDSPPTFTDFHPIILCTASRRVHGGEVSEGGYIQGAADDHEAWACGLTPKLFWAHKTQLVTTNEENIPSLIAELVKAERGPDAVPILIKPTTRLYVSLSQNVDISEYEVVISCTPEPLTTTNLDHLKTKKYLHLPLAIGKLGSRDLRTQLLRLPAFFEALPEDINNILICCPTGKDLSIGVALVILCLYFNDDGRIAKGVSERKIVKTFIKQRLTWITTTSAMLNPSRETLKSVNAFLMPDPSASAKVPTDTSSPMSKLLLVDTDGTPRTDESLEGSERIRSGATELTKEDLQTTSPPIALALFTNLSTATSGPWSFHRTLSSKVPTHPSGTVTGTATFSSYSSPSPSGQSSTSPLTTVLYSEEGEFITDTGLRFTARRKYIYKLKRSTNEKQEQTSISVHFFDDEKAKRHGENHALGGLFVEMGDLAREDGVWVAKNREQHLCGEDLYTASWRFAPRMMQESGAREEDIDVGGGDGNRGGGELWWEVRYDVKGPKKDYVSETRYSRAVS